MEITSVTSLVVVVAPVVDKFELFSVVVDVLLVSLSAMERVALVCGEMSDVVKEVVESIVVVVDSIDLVTTRGVGIGVGLTTVGRGVGSDVNRGVGRGVGLGVGSEVNGVG